MSKNASGTPSQERQGLPSCSLSSASVDPDAVYRKLHWRLTFIFFIMIVLNYVDRTNLAFAALQMNEDLGFTTQVYGLGSSAFFTTYATLQIPSNLLLSKFGGPTWLAAMMGLWGLTAALFAAVKTKTQFYLLRALLGVAEAGSFPGIWFMLSQFFPPDRITIAYATLDAAMAISNTIVGPIAASILSLDGKMGLRGWQWLFVLEGIPSMLLAAVLVFILPASIEKAHMLTDAERKYLRHAMDAVQKQQESNKAESQPLLDSSSRAHNSPKTSSPGGFVDKLRYHNSEDDETQPNDDGICGATVIGRCKAGDLEDHVDGKTLTRAATMQYGRKDSNAESCSVSDDVDLEVRFDNQSVNKPAGHGAATSAGDAGSTISGLKGKASAELALLPSTHTPIHAFSVSHTSSSVRRNSRHAGRGARAHDHVLLRVRQITMNVGTVCRRASDRYLGPDITESIVAAFSNKWVWYLGTVEMLKDTADYGILFFVPMIVQSVVGGSKSSQQQSTGAVQGGDMPVTGGAGTGTPAALRRALRAVHMLSRQSRGGAVTSAVQPQRNTCVATPWWVRYPQACLNHLQNESTGHDGSQDTSASASLSLTAQQALHPVKPGVVTGVARAVSRMLMSSESHGQGSGGAGRRDTGVKAALLSAIPFGLAAGSSLIIAHSSQYSGERVLHTGLPPLIGGAAIVFLPTLAAHSSVAAFMTLVLAVVGVGAASSPGMSLLSELAAGPGLVVAYPLFNSLGNMGGLLGPSLIGYFLERTNNSWALPCVLMATCLVAAGTMLLMLPRFIGRSLRLPGLRAGRQP